MRLRVAKIDQQAVPQVLCDIPVETLDHLRTGLLVGAHDLTEIFRVQLASELRGANHVTKQHGELAAFGVGDRPDVDCSADRYVRRRRSWVGVVYQRHNLRRAGSRGRYRGTRPHQDTALLIRRQLLPINEFIL
jgi:hypothetical protein